MLKKLTPHGEKLLTELKLARTDVVEAEAAATEARKRYAKLAKKLHSAGVSYDRLAAATGLSREAVRKQVIG